MLRLVKFATTKSCLSECKWEAFLRHPM